MDIAGKGDSAVFVHSLGDKRDCAHRTARLCVQRETVHEGHTKAQEKGQVGGAGDTTNHVHGPKNDVRLNFTPCISAFRVRYKAVNFRIVEIV
jgi:hypothetical protein